MSARFVNVDRETPLLLPPDLRDWVAEDDLAHFILEALDVVDLSRARLNHRGSGDAQYPPGMMLAVLIYCYSHGIMSSRDIERATYQHVAVRFLSGNLHPDHDTLATFRRVNSGLIESAFVEILQLAKSMKMLRLGTVALDGTKIKAVASKRHTRTCEQLEQELAALEQTVQGLLLQAEAADQAPAAVPGATSLPPELMKAQARRAKLRAAHETLQAQAQARHAANEAWRTSPERPPGAYVRKMSAIPDPQKKSNLSDPESNLQPTRAGFIQGYNAQIVVEADTPCGLILAAHVGREVSDKQQLAPMIQRLVANVGTAPQTVLVDTGYENYVQVAQVQQQYQAEVLLPPARNPRRNREGTRSRNTWTRRSRAMRDQMKARLEQPEGKAQYARRGTTVEPVFGILKEAMGLRSFQCRGLDQVQTEWTLACLAFNCRRLAAHRPR